MPKACKSIKWKVFITPQTPRHLLPLPTVLLVQRAFTELFCAHKSKSVCACMCMHIRVHLYVYMSAKNGMIHTRLLSLVTLCVLGKGGVNEKQRKSITFSLYILYHLTCWSNSSQKLRLLRNRLPIWLSLTHFLFFLCLSFLIYKWH